MTSLAGFSKRLQMQLSMFDYSGNVTFGEKDKEVIKAACKRMEVCLNGLQKSKWTDINSFCCSDLPFEPSVSVQYTVFLYFLGAEYHLSGMDDKATMAYLLNKALHNVEMMYTAKLPNIFFCEHPVGAILATSAVYKGNLFFYQGITIGGNKPLFGYGGGG